MKLLAKGSFVLGVVVAILLAFLPGIGNKTLFLGLSWQVITIIGVGIFAGILNVKFTRSHGFLIATCGLLVIGNAGLMASNGLGTVVGAVMFNIVAFIAPAAMIVSLKAIYEMAFHD